MKAGPEKDLAERYLERFAKSGPALGLDFRAWSRLPKGRAQPAEARRRDEAARLLAQLAGGAALIALDERGKNLTSEQFAAALARFRAMKTGAAWRWSSADRTATIPPCALPPTLSSASGA